jgi:hypothetical protein
MWLMGHYMDRVVAHIRELQSRSHFWSVELYNCNAFVADIANFMGLKAHHAGAALDDHVDMGPLRQDDRVVLVLVEQYAIARSNVPVLKVAVGPAGIRGDRHGRAAATPDYRRAIPDRC